MSKIRLKQPRAIDILRDKVAFCEGMDLKQMVIELEDAQAIIKFLDSIDTVQGRGRGGGHGGGGGMLSRSTPDVSGGGPTRGGGGPVTPRAAIDYEPLPCSHCGGPRNCLIDGELSAKCWPCTTRFRDDQEIVVVGRKSAARLAEFEETERVLLELIAKHDEVGPDDDFGDLGIAFERAREWKVRYEALLAEVK